ncbi:hypothetical protein [uncultured Ruminococcus sp.]|uniref:hypothetical protein n=1 Tax=uncultured Ruminococcus sp. TaxID=165186 RepID=UPI0026263EFD|nr:hypothetical protein [uncultured Ruminococcus sp.]
MGKMLERKCRYCGKEYKYEGVANFIAFCPHCKRYDFSESEYGYGSITPCRIIIGEKTIGEVKGDSKSGYELLVPELEIYEKLNESIFPLTQAADIVDYKMNQEMGYMDFHSGELILLGERLCRGYTFRQFKKSPMYCGQNGERYITLNSLYVKTAGHRILIRYLILMISDMIMIPVIMMKKTARSKLIIFRT